MEENKIQLFLPKAIENMWYRLDFPVNASQVFGHCLELAKTLESCSHGILDCIRIV